MRNGYQAASRHKRGCYGLHFPLRASSSVLWDTEEPLKSLQWTLEVESQLWKVPRPRCEGPGGCQEPCRALLGSR